MKYIVTLVIILALFVEIESRTFTHINDRNAKPGHQRFNDRSIRMI
jgi:hypothetical protein